MKIEVCDICYKQKKILKECDKVIRVKNRVELKLHFCNECKPLIPKDMVDYVIFVYKLDGLDVSKERARTMLGIKNENYSGGSIK
jgi:hypothetical protein